MATMKIAISTYAGWAKKVNHLTTVLKSVGCSLF